MNLFDIVGPVMIGPSSSHTAGAVKIGNICRKLFDEKLVRAKIGLHGSFLLTGRGHGTDKALVGGLLGLSVDDARIPFSFDIAKEDGMEVEIFGIDLGDVHPNSVKLELQGEGEKTLEIVAASIGGGRIQICEIDGITVNFSGDFPTLVVHNLDMPGHVTAVSGLLGKNNINIATMQLYRKKRGGEAVMVLECDQEVSKEIRDVIEKMDGILKVTYLGLDRRDENV